MIEAAVSVSKSFGKLAARIVVRTAALATTSFNSTLTSMVAVTDGCGVQPAAEWMARQTEEARRFQQLRQVVAERKSERREIQGERREEEISLDEPCQEKAEKQTMMAKELKQMGFFGMV